MSLQVIKLGKQDFGSLTALICVFEEVFEMKNFHLPDKDYLQHLLENDNFLVFTAMNNGQVVGGLTAYILPQYYSPMPLAYIFDLAVLTQYQRQGIGTRLMQAIRDYCKSLGVEEVFVQADQTDSHALEFYHATGGNPEKVVHFTYSLLGR